MGTASKRFFADVVVCGGGVAGAAAAIAAGRAGKRVFLLEYRESLGGLVTNGYITGIAGCIDGLCREWLERLDAEGHATMRAHLPVVEPEYGRVMLEQMVLQSGARILYGTHVVDVEKEGDRIRRVIAYCKSGRIELEADVFIDATGDADLAVAAGCPYEVGNAEFMGLNQSVTMGFKLSYVDLERYYTASAAFKNDPEYDAESPKHSSFIVHQEYKAMENGDLHELLSPGYLVYAMPGDRKCTDVTLDATHTFDCHCDDVVDLTRQIVDQHRKVYLFVNFMKKYLPGFEKAQLVAMAGMNGIRDSRRIIGEYVLRDIDVAGGIKFEDGIALFPEVLDTHVPTPGKHCAVRHVHYKEPFGNAVARPAQDQKDFMMHPFVPLDGYELRTNPRDYCEIPYRSLVAVGVDNLLVAGRCYSAEFHALGATRVIATSMSMGQAAGHAAAMSVQKQILPREVDGKELRALLVAEGAHLNEPPMGYWETVRNTEGEFFVNTADTISIRSNKAPSFM